MAKANDLGYGKNAGDWMIRSEAPNGPFPPLTMGRREAYGERSETKWRWAGLKLSTLGPA